jgi:hypothetical protein
MGVWLVFIACSSARALDLPPPRSEMPPLVVGIIEGGAQAGAYVRPMCPEGEACLLRKGGGVGLRLEWRFPSMISTGLGLDYSFIDGEGLYEVGTLATLRYTLRVHFLPLARVHPLIDVGIGGAIFGDFFSVDTFGGVADLRGGAEVEISDSMAVDFALGVRLLGLAAYTTEADDVRRGSPFGPSVMVGIHLGLVLLPAPLRPRPPRHHPEARDRSGSGGGL